MNAGEKRIIKIGFPIALYLKQLFSADTYVRFINPFSFWRRYRIDHLETCHELDIVQYLESCHQLDWRRAKPNNIRLERDCADIPTNSILKQAELNTIYISQPGIKLKYRGVSYYTKSTLNIDINVVEIDPSIVESNSLKCTDNFNHASTPEKSGSN